MWEICVLTFVPSLPGAPGGPCKTKPQSSKICCGRTHADYVHSRYRVGILTTGPRLPCLIWDKSGDGPIGPMAPLGPGRPGGPGDPGLPFGPVAPAIKIKLLSLTIGSGYCVQLWLADGVNLRQKWEETPLLL